MSVAKHWCFTINNYSDAEQEALYSHGENILTDPTDCEFTYLLFAREVGQNGTPHLQGYLILGIKLRRSGIVRIQGFERAALFVARGTPLAASDYCKKGSPLAPGGPLPPDFAEFGSLTTTRGQGSRFEQLRSWVAAEETAPTLRDVWTEFPDLAARYQRAVLECIALFGKKPVLVDGPLRPWQQQVNDLVQQEPNDREIIFVHDPEGNNGKSWLTRYWLSHHDSVQFMSVGKRDDLAHSVRTDTELFVFDVPRGQLEFFQYSILEQLKNRLVFSPKYNSTDKVLTCLPHVVVFTNDEVDMTKLTEDRYKVIEI